MALTSTRNYSIDLVDGRETKSNPNNNGPHRYVGAAIAVARHHVAVVVDSTAWVAVARLAAHDVVGQAEVLGPTLVAVPTNHVPLAPTLAYRFA